MGKGRDKRRKNETPAQSMKRAARQAQKQQRHSSKPHEADGLAGGFNNEEPIEATLRRIQKHQSKVKTVEELSDVAPPSPRGNVVLVAHPEREHELILFGGEYWNGAVTEAYNDTFFYHTKHRRWGKLHCACNPAPRSSSQGVVYKHYLILFGGEFVSQSQSQYLHFRDVWRFDARRSEWEELKGLAKHGPSSRSGHRMALWRRSAVMFGGFYDNALECHYYNDLWILSGLDGAGGWHMVRPAVTAGEEPRPRSGHNMAVYQDTVFVYGGYSTAKFDRFKKSEATVHHDLWMMTLAGQHDDGGGGASSSAPVWTRVKLGGVPPPIRAGVAAACKDRRMYLFGGVVDIESPGGSVVSTFHNDLFVFHMDSRRFYPVVLRPPRRGGADRDRAGRCAGVDNLASELRQLGIDASCRAGAEVSCCPARRSHPGHHLSGKETTDRPDGRGDRSSENSSSSSSEDEDEEDEEEEVVVVDIHAARSYEVRGRRGQVYPLRRMDAAMVIVNHTLYLYGGQIESAEKEITLSDLFALNLHSLASYEVLLSHDLSAATWKGKVTAESEADSWESGSTVVSAAFGMEDEEDNDDAEDAEDAGEDDPGDARVGCGGSFAALAARVRGASSSSVPLALGDDDEDEAPLAIPAALDVEVTPSYVDRVCYHNGKKGLQVHKAQLLAQLGSSASVPTPLTDESFDAFYQRTGAMWERAAAEAQSGCATITTAAKQRLSARGLKKESRAFARRRYAEARQLLGQLRLVEEREEAEARFFRERRLQKEREWQEYEEEQRRDETAPALTEDAL